MPSPKELKKSRSKHHCRTEGCATFLYLADGHLYCVACLDDTYFKPTYKKQKCPHCASFNASSYRNRQCRRVKLMEGEGSQGKGSVVDWGDYYIPMKKKTQPVSSSGESGEGTPLKRLHSPLSITSDQQREYKIDMARCSSPATGDKIP